MKLSELTKLVGGEITSGSDIEIERVAKIEEASPGDITFLANPKYKKYLATTFASAVLVEKNTQFKELEQRSKPLHLVRVTDPYISFLRLVDKFCPPAAPLPKGIHPSAVIAKNASIGSHVAIGAHVAIGEHCMVGNNVSIYHGGVLGDNVEIAEESLLYANVAIRENCKIGKRVIVHSGTVIGSDGFGFAPNQEGTYEKIPQRGIVVIEDDVEIGANCTIDRATIGETRIKRGVKLDNLIQVAHNVVIGENTVIAAQSGISGSTKIGKNCIIAGQVGFSGHLTIADRTTIGAQSGIPKSITEEGKIYFGYPAKELQRALRTEAALRELPELLVEFRQLKNRIEELERLLRERTSERK
jgi:UDP-3-O-[3-hydroxymyristoyl] glucosamine N-acyltransferase